MVSKKVLHHLGTGAGFVGLMAWYYAADQLGAIGFVAGFFPESHLGAGLMVGIMVLMTPAFFIWKLYNRWLEQRLNITGKYYEDDFYREDRSD